jgi:hypothetical protein
VNPCAVNAVAAHSECQGKEEKKKEKRRKKRKKTIALHNYNRILFESR